MSIDYVKANADIVQDSKDLVFSQFVNSDNLQKIIEIIAEEAKSYEEVAEKVFTSFLLVNAVGFTLDSIGEFFNFPRDGREDDEYRTALIISAIGSRSSITRDSIYNLVEIATGGLGGTFYNGRYHDIYMYLQDGCVERTIASEFISKYLPVNTQASVLLESGNSFGFANNDLASGFSKVYQVAGEGDAYINLSYADISDVITPVLPRAFEFVGTNGYTYRTEFENSLNNKVAALYWDIPTDYISGDVVSITARDNITRELFSDSLTIASAGTAESEIATFLTDFFVNNSITNAENIAEDTTEGHEIYIGFEAGLTAPISGARVQGFFSDFTIIITAKNTQGLEGYCRVNLINLTKGLVDGPWGLQLNPVEQPENFTLGLGQLGPDFYDGFGEEGLVIPEESFSEAGGFCSRTSLTSRDILGLGTAGSPEELEYDLDSKLSDVVGLSRFESFENFKTARLIGDYNLFAPHEWDSALSAATPSTSQSAVLRSTQGVDAFALQSNIATAASNVENKPDLYGNIDINSADINLPQTPYYFEVDFNKLANSTSIVGSAFRNDAQSFNSVTRVVDGDEVLTVTKDTHWIAFQNEYDDSNSNYRIRVLVLNNSYKYDYNIDTGVYSNELYWSSQVSEEILTYTDAVAEGAKTIGALYDPIGRTYRVFINGVEYNGTDGFLKYTAVTGNDTTGAVAGDIFQTPATYRNSGIFQIFFEVDNSEPEPATQDDYGTIEFIYNRGELKYISQLPTNTVDIFGRRIIQEI